MSQAHPLAFLEFVNTTNGGIERLGPRNETEEQRVQEQWKVSRQVDSATLAYWATQKRRDLEASKLQEEYEKKFRHYESYIERLEAKAGQLLHVVEGIS
jgi:breast cancer 2 susceptibility protein